MKMKRFKLRRINLFPTLITVGNLLCGFGALTMAMGGRLERACYLVFAAMVFDLLDGQVARITGSVSAFGEEMDSLADLVSFGVAPATIATFVFRDAGFPSRFGWIIGALFLGCGALRLARYNVESAKVPKDRFSGIPIPGAAGCVASIVILRSDLLNAGWVLPFDFDPSLIATWLGWMLPYMMVALAVMMMSRLPYPHMGHKLFRGKRSFAYLLGLLLAMVLFFQHHAVMLALAFNGYMMVGPVTLLKAQLARARHREGPLEAPPGEETPE